MSDLINLSEETAQESSLQQEKVIFGVLVSEIERQCQASNTEYPFDQVLNDSVSPKDAVIDGGNKILDDSKTLELVRSILN